MLFSIVAPFLILAANYFRWQGQPGLNRINHEISFHQTKQVPHFLSLPPVAAAALALSFSRQNRTPCNVDQHQAPGSSLFIE
ncbi:MULTISPECIES: hypothetical protein [Marinobacter]|uniref:hypothetical protein n=1 Tax=Marinobacter TaxID=2742 RepID=UPI0011811922|nr:MULTISPECIES: hypothetical protein [Marinobacter]MBD3655115.1 hypothetical protein [Marinobacter sp.]